MTNTATPPPRSSTITLVVALDILARDIQTDDGVANTALREASNRLSELHLMVLNAHSIIKAQHGAEHMLDGFRPKVRDIDGLLAQFDREMAEVDK